MWCLHVCQIDTVSVIIYMPNQATLLNYHRHLIMSANRVLMLQVGTDEKLPGRQHIASSIWEDQDSQLKCTSHSGCLHYASKVSLLPDTKPIHLHGFERANVS